MWSARRRGAGRNRPVAGAAAVALVRRRPRTRLRPGRHGAASRGDGAALREREGGAPRADNLTLRYTHDAGRRDTGWEDRLSSIVVTSRTVLIHKNGKVGLEITPRTRRGAGVRVSAAQAGRSRLGRSYRPNRPRDGPRTSRRHP